jgi:MFS family permease
LDRPAEANTDGSLQDEANASAFAALNYRDFRLVWIGQSCSAFAMWMENIARPLLVLEITHNDAAQLGAVIAVRTIPTLLLGLWAGVIADWFDRKTVLRATRITCFVVSLLFAVLLLSGRLELWHIYLLVFFRGGIQAFDQPVRGSLVPSMVPARLVTSAMALLSSTQNLMRIIGAAGAGASVGFIGLDGTFVCIAVLYAGSVITTSLLRVEAHERPTARGAGAMLAGMLEGLGYARRRPEVLGVLIVALVHFGFGMVYVQVFTPLFAVHVLDIGRSGLGYLLAFSGAGALLAALSIARQPPARIGLVLPLGVSVMGLALMVFSASTYLPSIAGLIFPFVFITAVGACQATFMSLSRALLVQAAPIELRGRVLSLISLDRAAMAIGAAVAGLVADSTGVQVAQLVFGVTCLAGGLAVLVLIPGLRRFRLDGIGEAVSVVRPAVSAEG